MPFTINAFTNVNGRKYRTKFYDDSTLFVDINDDTRWVLIENVIPVSRLSKLEFFNSNEQGGMIVVSSH